MSEDPATRAIAPVRWFGLPARTVIVCAVGIFAAGTLVFRVWNEEDPDAIYRPLIGVPSEDVLTELGEPASERSDGKGGTVLSFHKTRVVDAHFAPSELRIYIDPSSRIYHVERD